MRFGRCSTQCERRADRRDPGSVEPAEVGAVLHRSPNVLLAASVDVLTTSAPLLDGGRRPDGDRSAGDLGVVQHHGIRSDDRTGPNDTPVEHHGPVADEDVILDRAPLEMDQMTEHAIVADDRRPLRRGVQHGIVLHARAFADVNLAAVPPDDRTRPHGGQCADRHRPDDRGLRVNKCLTTN